MFICTAMDIWRFSSFCCPCCRYCNSTKLSKSGLRVLTCSDRKAGGVTSLASVILCKIWNSC